MLGLIYAAEAHHSREATRYIVGFLQMEDDKVQSKLTLLDLWCNMIENWGDAMKDYGCAANSKLYAGRTLIKMSRYMWRTWKSMSDIYEKLKVMTRNQKSSKQLSVEILRSIHPAIVSLFKFNNTRRCEIDLKLTLKKPEWHPSGGFIVDFEHISDFCLEFFFVDFEQVNVCWEIIFKLFTKQ